MMRAQMPRPVRFLRLHVLWIASVLCVLTPARALNRWVVFPERPETLPAVRYATLTAEQCFSELSERQLAVERGPKRQTIDAPVVLPRELRGVRFEFAPRVEQRDVVDCRLLLALDDLARIGATLGIAAVRYNSIYRNGWARGRVQGHLGAVAIDIVELVLPGGDTLNVLRDFAGSGIGSATCGAAAKPAPPGKATQMRRFVCALDDARVFNLVLSPHYDWRHRNHFHLEVRRGVRWFLTQ